MRHDDVILGQITCPKCGVTYSTGDIECPICNFSKHFPTDLLNMTEKKRTFYTAPERPDNPADCDYAIFLGGTIEGGTGVDWQKELSTLLKEVLPNDVNINVYNPRRPHWDQNCDVNERINQIKWEHYYLDRSNIIVMNLMEDSKSPISLMEIGMCANSGNLLVFCPKSFYRYENIYCVCRKYGIPLYDTNNVNVIAEKVIERMNLDLL